MIFPKISNISSVNEFSLMYSKQLLFILSILLISESSATTNNPDIGKICHVEANYYYPGVWERYSDTELICNYWKFLDDEYREELESQLNEDGGNEAGNNYGDYDSYDEMNKE